MAIRPNSLLTDMARQALQGGPNGPASNAALFDWLQEHPASSYEAMRLAWQKGRGITPKWAYEAICERTGSRAHGIYQLCLMEDEPVYGSAGDFFRCSMTRAHLNGEHAWLVTRSHTRDWPLLARIAAKINLGLFLCHCPERRRFPWLLGLVNRPTIGLCVYTWEDS